ncbi:MAG: hypothetical protein WC554_13510 [Clostridia bacterium]
MAHSQPVKTCKDCGKIFPATDEYFTTHPLLSAANYLMDGGI